MLLKFRPRSEKEIYGRLEKKKFNIDVIKEVIAFLKEKRFIDDNYFARAWLESRIKKPLGIRRLKEELRVKGIAKEIIDNQINEIRKNYSEQEIVEKIIREKFNKIKDADPRKAKRRVYAYLLRRGFSPDIVIDTINQINT